MVAPDFGAGNSKKLPTGNQQVPITAFVTRRLLFGFLVAGDHNMSVFVPMVLQAVEETARQRPRATYPQDALFKQESKVSK